MNGSVLRWALLFALVCPAMRGAVNPEPCDEEWRCGEHPFLGVTWSKSEPRECVGSGYTWTAYSSVSLGTRLKCEEVKRDVGITGITWTWTISGPTSASGSGISTTFTPSKCGSYTIRFTATGTEDSPCGGTVSASTDAYPFTVECESCTAATTGGPVCPGACASFPLTITNTSSDCAATFIYDTTLGEGTPTLNVKNGTGSVSLLPGRSETVGIKVCADKETAKGSRSFHVSVYGSADASAHCEATGEVTVDLSGSLVATSAKICPGSASNIATLTNSTECTLTYTWTATSAGPPTIVLHEPTGSVTLSPHASANIVSAAVDQASARGSAVITVNAYCQDGSTCGEQQATVTVPPAEGSFAFNDRSCPKLSPGADWRLPFTVKNTGDCTEDFYWTITVDSQIEVHGAGFGGPGHTRKAAGAAGHFALHVHISEASTIHSGDVHFHAVLSNALGYVLSEDDTCLKITKCELSATDKAVTVTKSFETEAVWVKEFTDKLADLIHDFEGFAQRFPGAKVVPEAPKLTGELSLTTGGECCPGATEPTPYKEYGGKGGIGAGIKVVVGPEWQTPPLPIRDPFSGYLVLAQAYVKLTAEAGFNAAGSVGIKGHAGTCRNCVEVSGNVRAGFFGTVTAGGGGRVEILKKVGNVLKVIKEYAVELSVKGGVDGQAVNITGTTSFGDCAKPTHATICGGPVRVFAKIKVQMPWGFSLGLPEWTFEIIPPFGSGCD